MICMEGTKESKALENEATSNRNDTKYVIITRTVREKKEDSFISTVFRRGAVGAVAGAAAGGLLDTLVTTEQLATREATLTLPGPVQVLQDPTAGQVVSVDGLKFEIIRATSNNLTLQQLSGTSKLIGQPMTIPANGNSLELTVHNGVVTGYTYFLQNVNIHMVHSGATQFLTFDYGMFNGTPSTSFLDVSTISGKLAGAGNVVWSYLPTGIHLFELTVVALAAAGTAIGAAAALFRLRRKSDDEDAVQKA